MLDSVSSPAFQALPLHSARAPFTHPDWPIEIKSSSGCCAPRTPRCSSGTLTLARRRKRHRGSSLGACSGRNTGKVNEFLERETGFEPATSTLARSHSTAELLPL